MAKVKKGRKAQAAEADATATKKKGKGRKARVRDEEDEDEEEGTTTRGRARKDYGVTGADILRMREEDEMSWQEIQDEVGAKSAIPLRQMMNEYKTQQDGGDAIDPDDGDAIVAARDEEALGWGQIAARTGLAVGKVKKAYVEAGGEHVEQRAYKDKDGNVHFGGARNGKAEVDEEETSDYDEMDRSELVAELNERGLSTKGKTSALRARLVEADAESEEEEPEPEPEPTPKRKKGKGKKAKAGRS